MTEYQAPYNLDSTLNELPISLQYSEDSNNAKMLKLFADEMVNIQSLLNKIEEWRDIDNAQGKALDMIGEDHGVYRNGVDDAFYRFEIKLKRIQRITDGTYDSLIRLVANALNADPSDIYVNGCYETDSKEPDAVEITNIPDAYIDDTRKQALVMSQLQQTVAAGIRVAKVEYQSAVLGNAYVGGIITSMNTVTIPSDVDVTTFERDVTNDSYIRSTQQVISDYQLESEEINYG